MKFAKVLYCLAFIILTASLANSGQIDPRLSEKLLSPNNRGLYYKVLVVLAEQADITSLDLRLSNYKATLTQRHFQVISALQEVVGQTQPQVATILRRFELTGEARNIRSLWLANLIAFEGKAEAIQAVALSNAVDKIYLDLPISLIEPNIESKPSPPGHLITGHETSLDRIHAPEVWALGYTGAGRVVANLDTGVDGFHPALSSRFRGDIDGDGDYSESWYDPYNTQWTYPQDGATHGTHTMGTSCGRTSSGDTIGVAIDAKWIAAACIDRGGGIQRTVSDALLALQWIADPDGNPITQDNPDACGNSWGIPDDNGFANCDQTFWIAIDNCEAAGTVIIFAAGNEGAAGLRSPADRATTYYNCFAVGAVDSNNPSLPIASFSALGPSECARGDMAIKPDIVAPGVNIRSSIRGGGYQSFSGTSMACPHVAGAVAILRQVNPNLDANSIKQILIQSAGNLGPAGDDNTYGNGIINLYQAVLLAINFGGIDGYVRDASTHDPLPAKMKVLGAPIQIIASDTGYYYIGLKADTTYTIDAECYGYLSAQQSATIIAGDTIRKDFNLLIAPRAILQGRVISNRGDAIVGAEVKILGTPLPAETTDISGQYQFLSIPTGALYFIQVKADDYTAGFDSIVVQNGMVNTLDFVIWPIESFERTNGEFTGGNVWQWGIPSYGPSAANSGVKCWGTLLDGPYPNSSQDTLKSPLIFISSRQSSLQFYHWYQFEDYYDGGNVIISSDAGHELESRHTLRRISR
jgi:bacillopeptidase F